MLDEYKIWNIIKNGAYLPHKIDVDISTLTTEERRICSANNPCGIYNNLAEMVETEYKIPFDDYCQQMGLDVELNRYSTYVKWSNE